MSTQTQTAPTFVDADPFDAPARPAGKPATQKQRDFIARLLSDRATTPEDKAAQLAAINREDLTTAEASAIIDVLLSAPKAERPVAATLEPGMYQRGDDIFKVQRSRTSGGLYAKRLEDGQFVYAAGAVRNLTAADRMSREQAAAYGRETGVCCVCGRELTNPESVAAGIGPDCSSRF